MKFWPTRQKHKAELVADLDALVNDPVAFKVLGKEHIIEPISAVEFFKYTNAYAKLWNLTEGKTITLEGDKLIDAYHELFSAVCKTITRKDIEAMSQAQIGALFQVISDTVTGRYHVDQKKTLKRVMATGIMANQF